MRSSPRVRVTGAICFNVNGDPWGKGRWSPSSILLKSPGPFALWGNSIKTSAMSKNDGDTASIADCEYSDRKRMRAQTTSLVCPKFRPCRCPVLKAERGAFKMSLRVSCRVESRRYSVFLFRLISFRSAGTMTVCAGSGVRLQPPDIPAHNVRKITATIRQFRDCVGTALAFVARKARMRQMVMNKSFATACKGWK